MAHVKRWYEEHHKKRFMIQTRAWIIDDKYIFRNIDHKKKKEEIKDKKTKHSRMSEIAHKVIVGQRMSGNIMGTLKGRLLNEAEIPDKLKIKIGHQLSWHVENSLIQDKNMIISGIAVDFPEYCTTDENKKDRNVYDEFLVRMDKLIKEETVKDSMSGLITGLKSWLQFGNTITQNVTSNDAENKKLYLENNDDKSTGKVNDQLTRRSQEKISKIAGEFCVWLRGLPIGQDDTVNKTQESHIKALFNTTQVANANKSKLAEGLKSWMKFGEQVTRSNSVTPEILIESPIVKLKGSIFKRKRLSHLAVITAQQLTKKKFRQQYHLMKSHKRKKKIFPETFKYENNHLSLTRTNYGVWHIKPHLWESRFINYKDQEMKFKRSESSPSIVVLPEDISLSKLDSTHAFVEFLKDKKINYEAPNFLRHILIM